MYGPVPLVHTSTWLTRDKLVCICAAKPKSSPFTVPSAATITLPGLMSRWMIFWLWA